jgi:hypothetical protein
MNELKLDEMRDVQSPGNLRENFRSLPLKFKMKNVFIFPPSPYVPGSIKFCHTTHISQFGSGSYLGRRTKKYFLPEFW